MQELESNPQVKHMHKKIRQYMHMVVVMCLYIRAVWTGHGALHISALEKFVKYFFALDKLNYARMIPIYLTEMSQLERTYPKVWSVFSNGNWVVNKNTIPFCAIGPDHALEQINRLDLVE